MEKLHAAVARSAFASEHVKNSRSRTIFWKLGCVKIVPLWREAHVQVKMLKK